MKRVLAAVCLLLSAGYALAGSIGGGSIGSNTPSPALNSGADASFNEVTIRGTLDGADAGFNAVTIRGNLTGADASFNNVNLAGGIAASTANVRGGVTAGSFRSDAGGVSGTGGIFLNGDKVCADDTCTSFLRPVNGTGQWDLEAPGGFIVAGDIETGDGDGITDYLVLQGSDGGFARMYSSGTTNASMYLGTSGTGRIRVDAPVEARFLISGQAATFASVDAGAVAAANIYASTSVTSGGPVSGTSGTFSGEVTSGTAGYRTTGASTWIGNSYVLDGGTAFQFAARVMDFDAGVHTRWSVNDGGLYDVAYLMADGYFASRTPETLLSLFTNAINNAQTYGGIRLRRAFTVTNVSLYVNNVAGGGTNDVIRLTDGTNICEATFACATDLNTTGVKDKTPVATAGSCTFPAGANLVVSETTAGCTPDPTLKTIVIQGWNQ